MDKVLYISAVGYLGGAERFLLNVCSEHLRTGHFEPLILFFDEGEAVSEARARGISVIVLKQKFKLSRPIALLKAILEIRQHCLRLRPAYIHSTMAYAQIVMGLAAHGISAKRIWFQHGPVGGLLDKIASLFPSHLLLFNSQYLQQQHHATTPVIRTERESIIKLGINPPHHHHPLFQQDTIILGSCGRICSWKGYHLVLQALGELKQETPLKSFTYLIAGSVKTERDKAYYQHIQQLRIDYNLQNEVHFVDHIAEINSFYQKLDVFIHASTIPEPFGLVVAEAMASGCLVIGSDKGGVTDILNRSTGITFASTSEMAVQSLKLELKKLISQEIKIPKQELQLLANNGRDLILNEYSLKAMITQIEQIYSNF